MGVDDRREVGLRRRGWVRGLAARLARRGVRPNAVSSASVVAAAGTAACLLLTGAASSGAAIALLRTAAALVALRGLVIVLDGLIAIEGGLVSRSGVVFNDLPDRVSELITFAAAGYAAGSPAGVALGWLSAGLAVLTAYIRVLGASAGQGQDFSGPMAKPRRIAVLALMLVAAAALHPSGRHHEAILVGLAVVAAGSLVTAVRRAVRLVRALEAA